MLKFALSELFPVQERMDARRKRPAALAAIARPIKRGRKELVRREADNQAEQQRVQTLLQAAMGERVKAADEGQADATEDDDSSE